MGKKFAAFRVAAGLHTSSSADVADDVSFVEVQHRQQEEQQQQQQSRRQQQVLTKLDDCLNAFTQPERVSRFGDSFYSDVLHYPLRNFWIIK
jgi:hypothetical protein